MKASIVIPAHNEAGYIARTLEAALNQDFDGPYEVIVVDNASVDSTGDIARRFPVTVIREDRKGLLHAREAGRRAARGEIIVQLDADSIPDRDWLHKGLAYFDDPRVVCVSGSYFYYDGKWSFRWASYGGQMVFFWGTHLLLSPLGLGCIGTGGNMFIRASALEQIGGYDTGIEFYGEDTDTARRLMSRGKVLYCPSLYVNSSARRFKNMGVAKVLTLYTLHWFSILIHKRPYEARKKAQ